MIYKPTFIVWVFMLSVFLSGQSFAQGSNVAFGGIKRDKSQPVEITADRFQVNEKTGNALFEGNVVVGQGDMRLSAAKMEVEYRNNDSSSGRIERLLASGGVTLVSGEEAAESAKAIYSLDSGQLVMSGNVLLTQGQNVISGQNLVVDLDKGTGVIEGRVKTIFQSGGQN